MALSVMMWLIQARDATISSGCGVWGLGFGVGIRGSGFEVWGLEHVVWVVWTGHDGMQGVGCGLQGVG